MLMRNVFVNVFNSDAVILVGSDLLHTLIDVLQIAAYELLEELYSL